LAQASVVSQPPSHFERKGYHVTLVEKNSQVGGKLNERSREGFSFDLGPSIFTLPHIFRDLFRRAGKEMEDYLTLERVTPHWRNFFEDGLTLDLYEEPELMQQEMAKLPGDVDRNWNELQQFLTYARGQYHLIDEGYLRRGLDTLWEMLRHYGLMQFGARFDYKNTMAEGIAQYLTDSHLREIFEYFIKYVGSSAKDAPSYMNMMPIIQYDYGLWYVKGGLYELAKALQKVLEELGIELRLGVETKQIERASNGREVSQVILADGESYRSRFCRLQYGSHSCLSILARRVRAISREIGKAFSRQRALDLSLTSGRIECMINSLTTTSFTQRTRMIISILFFRKGSYRKIQRFIWSHRQEPTLRKLPRDATI
jgi:phytoene desaturase